MLPIARELSEPSHDTVIPPSQVFVLFPKRIGNLDGMVHDGAVSGDGGRVIGSARKTGEQVAVQRDLKLDFLLAREASENTVSGSAGLGAPHVGAVGNQKGQLNLARGSRAAVGRGPTKVDSGEMLQLLFRKALAMVSQELVVVTFINNLAGAPYAKVLTIRSPG